MTFGPSDRYYDPPDPPEPCCALAEDDPDHDSAACMAEQAEAAAEAKADARRDERRGLFDLRRDLGRAPTAQEWMDERR